MNKEALALRNQYMAQAFHATPMKHRVRHALLQASVVLPPLPNQVYRRRPGRRERILLIRPDHMGDMLLTTPAVHALRTAKPDAEIHALVGPWSAELIASYPQVDLTLTLPFPAFSRDEKEGLRSPYELLVRTSRQLRIIGYNSAVIFRADHWWGAMLAKLAGIPERIGYDLPDVKPFLTNAVSHEHQHVVLQNMRLVEHWTGKVAHPIYDFPTHEFERGYVDGYLEDWGVAPGQQIIAIHAGSGASIKNWTDEKWADVADTLAGQLNAPIVLTGGDHELTMARNIAARMREQAIIAAGDTRIGQLAALFARAKVVLGPDSGPLHLASAVGVPTVALFGPADPAEFHPWGSPEKHRVLTSDIACRPCRILDWQGDPIENHPCVRDIAVGQVLDAARRVVN